jgi:hypothetical protein
LAGRAAIGVVEVPVGTELTSPAPGRTGVAAVFPGPNIGRRAAILLQGTIQIARRDREKRGSAQNRQRADGESTKRTVHAQK